MMGNDDNTGKRSAARNNSGLPVDHSGPGLRVGPTTSVTADQKSEACPPNVVSCSSQHKSGRESESGALSGASEASDELRSKATQRGSSLVEIEINRNSAALSIPPDVARLGRCRYCGAWTVVGRSEDGTFIFRRVNCKTWGCALCGPRKAKLYKWAIRHLAEQEGLSRFLTLTLDPAKIAGQPVRYLRQVFNKFRTYLRRKYEVLVKYIAVLEFQKSGIPHLHLLVDRYIPWSWITGSWSALGGGKIVDIKYVDVHRVARYLSKYLTKELLLSAPKRSRRVTTSRSLHLLEKKVRDSKWVLLKSSIFYLYSRLRHIADEIKLDSDGFLESFACVWPIAF